MNWTAISMFMVFVCFTLLVTRWAALRTRSASDFYTAGGGLTGMQNGLAIAGDMISAASFLGISAMPAVCPGRTGRLADHPVPDRRAPAQPGQIHLR